MLYLATILSSLSLLLGGAGPSFVQQEPAAQPVVALSITGHGWGHGVGMCQWGAYGFAQHGSTYAQILAHYYRGTELGRTPGPTQVRILLVDGATTLAIASQAPFAVEDATGESYDLAAGSLTLGNGLRIKVDPDKPAKQLTGPLVFKAGAAPLSVDGKRYRGALEVSVVNGRLRVVNVVGLDAYLLGVVPSEVPFTWPAEALKAQAVAARSYALAIRKPGRPFDAYADVRSQVYGGLDAEKPQTTDAVQATSGQIVLYGGKVATTYFFSTSGGRTASIEEAWPGAQPVPYLVSVPDPYDTASPYHTWGPLPVTAEKLRTTFKLPRVPVDARVEAGRSGRVSEVVFALSGGGEVSVPAGTVRAALGLRSTWFQVGVLALRPPGTSPVTFGTKAPFGGVVRALSNVRLERQPLGGGWEKVGAVAAGKNGEFTVQVRGQMTADYRLAADKLKGPAVRLVVAPKLKLVLRGAPGTLAGRVRPAFPGATVVVQRLERARWTRAATARVDARGAFGADLVLPAGTYRARLAPRAGYAVGLSEPLVVTS
ncbi:MAG TPA: SpoIID/LytB domain-containing protein [Gaiellaceae bacterium]|nr:SpoIID/LytB domain-containing protein [Gaiellaceae bacterium]